MPHLVADAVISCIGPAKNFSPGTVVSRGTSNIVAACQRAGVRRFVMQTVSRSAKGNELSVANRWAITFRDSDASGIEFIKADLSLMREAQRIAALLPAETLDLVIFTTGILAAPKRLETAEGIERDMAVSYLSRLVIVREIAPRLGRIGLRLG